MIENSSYGFCHKKYYFAHFAKEKEQKRLKYIRKEYNNDIVKYKKKQHLFT